MKTIDNRKIVLVGTGFVGMSMAYSFLTKAGIDELVLVDVAKEKAEGEAMDWWIFAYAGKCILYSVF